jgi:REP element-mobilizing transposase RayT
VAFYPDKHHRRTVRLREYDYSSPGAYFVTVCTEARRCTLGAVVGEQVRPSAAGEIVAQCWAALPDRFPDIQIDMSVIMPNHFHATILLVGARFIAPTLSRAEGVDPRDSTQPRDTAASRPTQPRSPSCRPGAAGEQRAAEEGAMNRAPTRTVGLGEVVRAFKGVSTRRIRVEADPGFAWQRNYYEHVLRDEERLAAARRYIAENPGKWGLDPERPR